MSSRNPFYAGAVFAVVAQWYLMRPILQLSSTLGQLALVTAFVLGTGFLCSSIYIALLRGSFLKSLPARVIAIGLLLISEFLLATAVKLAFS